ncbi:MAG: thermopsin family protease [Thaumarchaeota archaeon]|nr:thermopsin family protease [Nitrososphaerota archaeon]
MLQPLVISTSREVTIAKINSLSAYNSTVSEGYKGGANLQFNAISVAKTSNGEQIIWLQNTSRLWANGQISEDEFVKTVQCMISGIITIS